MSVKSAEVTLTLNNKEYVLSLTDGKANLHIPDLSVGKYDVIVKFAGDDTYEACSKTIKITIK